MVSRMGERGGWVDRGLTIVSSAGPDVEASAEEKKSLAHWPIVPKCAG